MSVTVWPTNRDCAVCQQGFFPKSTVQVYCSRKCSDRAKYERIRNDPERWAAYLAHERAEYVPKPKRPERECSVAGCDAKHLARGFCRKHYRRDRYRRGLDRETPVVIIAALLKRYDETGEFVEEAQPVHLVAKVTDTLLIPECPECGGVMVKVPTLDDDMDLRDCGGCRVRVLLNAEEVSWLTSGAPSTAPSRRTKKSRTISTRR